MTHICNNPAFDLFTCRACHPEVPPIGEPPALTKNMPGWTSYKFHTSIQPAPGLKTGDDSIWKSWSKTVAVVERVAFLRGLGLGLFVGTIIGLLSGLVIGISQHLK